MASVGIGGTLSGSTGGVCRRFGLGPLASHLSLFRVHAEPCPRHRNGRRSCCGPRRVRPVLVSRWPWRTSPPRFVRYTMDVLSRPGFVGPRRVSKGFGGVHSPGVSSGGYRGFRRYVRQYPTGCREVLSILRDWGLHCRLSVPWKFQYPNHRNLLPSGPLQCRPSAGRHSVLPPEGSLVRTTIESTDQRFWFFSFWTPNATGRTP